MQSPAVAYTNRKIISDDLQRHVSNLSSTRRQTIQRTCVAVALRINVGAVNSIVAQLTHFWILLF